MIAGMRGRLISATYARAAWHTLPGAISPSPMTIRALDTWSDRRERALGPASSVRAIVDVAVLPLLKLLGFDVSGRLDEPGRTTLTAQGSSGAAVPVLIVPWDEPLDRAWRSLVLDGVRSDARWCFCCNGAAWRIVDAHHTWSRRYLEFDLALVASEALARTIFWSVAHAEAMGRASSIPGSRRSAVRPSRSGRLQGARQRSARGSWPAVHGTGGIAPSTSPTRVVRAVSDGALPDSVSALCGSARPGPHVAPGLSRALQHRSDRLGAAGRTDVSRCVAGRSGDLAAGPRRLLGREP